MYFVYVYYNLQMFTKLCAECLNNYIFQELLFTQLLISSYIKNITQLKKKIYKNANILNGQKTNESCYSSDPTAHSSQWISKFSLRFVLRFDDCYQTTITNLPGEFDTSICLCTTHQCRNALQCTEDDFYRK